MSKSTLAAVMLDRTDIIWAYILCIILGTIIDVKAVPTWVHRYLHQGRLHYRVLPLARVIADQNDPMLTPADYLVLKAYLQELNLHITKWDRHIRSQPSISSASRPGQLNETLPATIQCQPFCTHKRLHKPGTG